MLTYCSATGLQDCGLRSRALVAMWPTTLTTCPCKELVDMQMYQSDIADAFLDSLHVPCY
jgi:hypothetical protein